MASPPPPPPPTRSSAPRRSTRQHRQPPSLDNTSTLDSPLYQQQQPASASSSRGRQPMTISISPRKRSRHGRLPSGDLSPTSLNRSRSPPSSDSGDEQDEEVPSPGGGVKRKRTRTLTTPQQASALYALLAQTRFPTTQQRETVGASIGLSARKVQIWFQNQRQKARKAQEQQQAESAAPPAPAVIERNSTRLGRPPAPLVLEPSLAATHGPPTFYRGMDQPISPYSSPAWHTEPHSAQPHQQRHVRHPDYDMLPPRPSSSMGQMFGPGVSQPSGSTLRSGGARATPPYQSTPKRDPPIVLPPLQFDIIKTKGEMMASQAAVSASGSPSSAAFGHSTRRGPPPSVMHPRSDLMRPRTPASVVTPSSVASGEFVNPSALGYSPPFTLQPEPQWNPRDRDPIPFTPGTAPRYPPHMASPLPQHITAERSRARALSDASSRQPYGAPGPSQSSPSTATSSHRPPLSHAVARGGRFDPVRGHVTPSPPHESMPPPPSGSGSGSGSIPHRDSGLRSPAFRESDSSRRK